jgi:hypothetical protein
LPATCDRRDITIAALRDATGGSTIVHVVNTGAARSLAINGLTTNANRARVYITDSQHEMKESTPVDVRDGRAEVQLPAQSYVTMIATK